MTTVVIIPARLGSTRLPQKMLKDVEGLPLIVRTYQSALAAGYQNAYVACDCDEIKKAITTCGGKAIITDPNLPSGTDRVYAAAKELDLSDDAIVINLQGDHPYINAKFIAATEELAQHGTAEIATPIVALSDDSYKRDSVVKVAATFYTEKYAHAHYFSRAPIPYNGPFYQHVGVYGYKMKALKSFVETAPAALEKSEKLEQLRALSIGMKIDTVLVDEEAPISVDTTEDLEKARSVIRKLKAITTIVLLCCGLTSCAPLVVGSCVGGIAGVSLRNREGISGTSRDNDIHMKILSRFRNNGLFDYIEVCVKHGRVLLIGFVPNERAKLSAINLARNVSGIKEIIDEIKIGHPQASDKAAADSMITMRIKSSLVVDSNIHSLNFNITTYNGVVYILGLAENKLENELVIRNATSTFGVEKVVSYINIEEK